MQISPLRRTTYGKFDYIIDYNYYYYCQTNNESVINQQEKNSEIKNPDIQTSCPLTLNAALSVYLL